MTQTQTVEFTSWLTDDQLVRGATARRRATTPTARIWALFAILVALQVWQLTRGAYLLVAFVTPVMILLVVVLSPWGLAARVRRAAAANPELTARMRMRLSAEGLDFASPTMSSHRSWQSFVSWLVVDDVLALNLGEGGNGAALYLGRGDADDHTWAAALAMLTDRLGPPKT